MKWSLTLGVNVWFGGQRAASKGLRASISWFPLLIEVSILPKDSRVFQGCLSCIRAVSFPTLLRHSKDHTSTLHWGGRPGRESSAGVLRGPQAPTDFSLQGRCRGLVFATPACTGLTLVLESPPTSRLFFHSSSLTKASCNFLAASVSMADSRCKELSSSYALKYSPTGPNWA